jgi:hypothetical protein
MNYVETQLYIPHKVESDFDVEKQNDNEVNKTIKYLTNLVELNYISLTENTLNLTKSGYDYFMRKCSINNDEIEFQYDSFAPMEIQQMIFQQFFANKSKVNTVEKFIKNNI